MRRRLRFFAAVLSAALFACILAGCSNDTSVSTIAATTTASPIANDEHVDLSFVWTNWNNKSDEDDEVFAWLDRKFNCTIEWINLANDIRVEKIGVLWASGEKFTASVGLEGTLNTQCLQIQYNNGWITAVDEYLKGCPNLSNDIPESCWNFVRMTDGQLYGIPDVSCYTETGLWVRQDWLKQFGFSLPETLSDLEEVMDTFHNRDPDGDGMTDTYGTAVLGSFTGFDEYLLGAFLPYGYSWQPLTNSTNDDVLYPVFMHQEYKDYLNMLANWTANGYIHPNQSMMNYDTSIAAFAQGEIGAFFSWYGEGDSGVGQLIAAFPDADPVFISCPGKTAGTGGTTAHKLYGSCIVFNRLASKAEITRYMSMLEYFDSDEGEAVRNYGIPGVHWVDNGDTVKLPEGKEKTYSGYCRLGGGPYCKHWRPLEGGIESINAATKACYSNSLNYVMPYDYMFPYDWSGTESENKISDLNKLINAAKAAIACGSRPVDSLDVIIEEWLAAGGQKYIEEYNKQYKELAPVYGNQ